MNKLKANSILASFIFFISLMLLCSFGTDAAYVILSRYKLQKITEYVAMEFASSKARDANYTIKTEEEKTQRENIVSKYESVYNAIGSGVMVFKITNMDYKADRVNKEAVVKVKTTSKVMPAFLRFVGVKEIIVHSTAYAKTNRVEIDREIEAEQNTGHYVDYASWQKSRAIFDFTTTKEADGGALQYADGITAKNNGYGDFMIQFGYKKRASWWPSSDLDLGSGGGFFVVAGYKKDPNSADVDGWVDIGNKATNKLNSELRRVCVNGENWASFEETNEFAAGTQCFYCVDAAKEGTIVFDLSKDTTDTKDTKGRLNRINTLWVLKAGGSGEQQSDGTYNNPCDPGFTQNNGSGGFLGLFAKWFKRDALVKLTILNNVTMINKKEYDSFIPLANGHSDEDIQGSWSANSQQ